MSELFNLINRFYLNPTNPNTITITTTTLSKEWFILMEDAIKDIEKKKTINDLLGKKQ